MITPGWGSTTQDHGRPGLAHLGVPHAGAVDRATHDLVNRLVGNSRDAATIETLGGLIVEAIDAVVVARSTDHSVHTLAPGDRLAIDPPESAVWAYLAIRGGVSVDAVLGSRSTDTLSGLGPKPLTAGRLIPVGPEPDQALVADHAPTRRLTGSLKISKGPHADWFEGGLTSLTARPWTISDDVSRVGARLVAQQLARTNSAHDRLSSFGLVEGAIQVTPSGELIVMLANHPTTGGYPVIAVVDPADLTVVARSRPGRPVRFSS